MPLPTPGYRPVVYAAYDSLTGHHAIHIGRIFSSRIVNLVLAFQDFIGLDSYHWSLCLGNWIHIHDTYGRFSSSRSIQNGIVERSFSSPLACDLLRPEAHTNRHGTLPPSPQISPPPLRRRARIQKSISVGEDGGISPVKLILVGAISMDTTWS
jgi:hypothetical protein